jgi:hypothetical protein
VKPIYVLSYGGGVNSSALYFYIIENNLPLDLVIFSDTGEELKETYDTVFQMALQCKKDNIKFVTVKSKYGKMYDYYFEKKAVMSIMRRDCTSKFKIAPIRQYLRGTYGKKQKFVQYIGIAWDEMQRVTNSDVKYIELKYPFVDDKIDRKGNVDILEKYNFKASKSGCVGCPFQSKHKWEKLCKTDLNEFERWEKLELNNSAYPKILINGSWDLTTFKKNVLSQKSLKEFIHIHEEDLNCPNIRGGCFL